MKAKFVRLLELSGHLLLLIFFLLAGSRNQDPERHPVSTD